MAGVQLRLLSVLGSWWVQHGREEGFWSASSWLYQYSEWGRGGLSGSTAMHSGDPPRSRDIPPGTWSISRLTYPIAKQTWCLQTVSWSVSNLLETGKYWNELCVAVCLPHAGLWSPLCLSAGLQLWGCRRDCDNLICRLYCSVHSPGSYFQAHYSNRGLKWESSFPSRPFLMGFTARERVLHPNINSLSQHPCERDFCFLFYRGKGGMGIWKTKVTINFHLILSKDVLGNCNRLLSPVYGLVHHQVSGHQSKTKDF